MRKAIRCLLPLLLIASLLCGCGAQEKTFQCMELKIVLTSEFKDLSEEKAGKDFTFLYASEDIGVAGIREEKSGILQQYEGLTLEGYAELTAKAAGVVPNLRSYQGIPYYTYTSVLEDVEFTYLAAAYDDGYSYWLLQCYCQSSRYESLSPVIWQYLDSVRF